MLRNVSRVAAFAIGGCVVFVASGAAQQESPELASFFNGKLVAKGKFSDYLSGSTRGMEVKINGEAKGATLNLVEDMVYSDGETRRYVWKFVKSEAGDYVGHRADLIGTAKVVLKGEIIEISYKAHVAMRDGKEHDLDFLESFSFVNPSTANYLVKISKIYIPVADAQLVVQKVAAAQ
jgi:hypothetical protein